MSEIIIQRYLEPDSQRGRIIQALRDDPGLGSKRKELCARIYGRTDESALHNIATVIQQLVHLGWIQYRSRGVIEAVSTPPMTTVRYPGQDRRYQARPIIREVPEDERWEPWMSEDRPRTRKDCLPGGVNEARPCPYVSCRHSLATETTVSGAVRLVDDWESMPFTCALDFVDENGHGVENTLEEIGSVLGVTRERIRQIEERAKEKLRIRVRKLGAGQER